MPDVRVAENPVLGQVRRAGPDGLRLAVLAQDEELVVHQLAVRSPLAKRLDLRRGDRVAVLLERSGRLPVLVEGDDVVVEHPHLGSALMSLLDRRERCRPLELVDGAVHLPALAGAPEECDERFEQPAREPLIGARPSLARRLVLEAARVFLGRDGAAVEERRVDGPGLRLGRDVELDLDPRLEARGVAVQRDDGVGVRAAGLHAVVGPLERLDRVVKRREALPDRRVRLGLLERLQSLEPDRVAFGVVEALEAEAPEPRPFALR